MKTTIRFGEITFAADRCPEVGTRLTAVDLVECLECEEGGFESAPVGVRDAVIDGYGPIRCYAHGSYYPAILRGVGKATRYQDPAWDRYDAKK
jgi:hypothetical protein